MKPPFACIFLALLGLFTGVAQAATYYVSSVSGDDSFSGTSTTTPFRTLYKLSTMTFSPGDTIKFKAGETFAGRAWKISSSGTNSTTGLITVTSYGTGNKPVLDGAGMPAGDYSTVGSETLACLIDLAPNVNYWKFANLKLTNAAIGINCYHPSTVTAAQNYFEIYACDFYYFSNTGVKFQGVSPRIIYDVSISHCNFKWSNTGIKLDGCRNSIIASSNLSEMDGGAIAMTDTIDGGLIADCNIWRTGKVYKASGTCAVYLANTRDLVIDGCEISYTYRATNPADPTKISPDGVAIDFESANKNITVSNCTLFNNDGAAVLVYRNPTWGFENRPLNFTGNTIYGNGLKGKGDGTPGGAQFMRHLQDQVSSPGEFASIDPGYGGIISGNTITLSNGTSTYLTQTHSSQLTNTAPGWYSVGP